MAFIFGFKSELARPEYAAVPVAPSNYGPEAAAKYVAKKLEELRDEAASIPVLATLTEVHVIDHLGQDVFHKESRLSAEVANALFRWIVDGTTQYQPAFGFRLKDMIEIGALECLAAFPGIKVPFHWWRMSNSLHDIYEYILPTDVRKAIGMKNLIHFLTREWVDTQLLYSDPRLQCNLGLKLLQRAQCLQPVRSIECFDDCNQSEAPARLQVSVGSLGVQGIQGNVGPTGPSHDAAAMVGPGRAGRCRGDDTI